MNSNQNLSRVNITRTNGSSRQGTPRRFPGKTIHFTRDPSLLQARRDLVDALSAYNKIFSERKRLYDHYFDDEYSRHSFPPDVWGMPPAPHINPVWKKPRPDSPLMPGFSDIIDTPDRHLLEDLMNELGDTYDELDPKDYDPHTPCLRKDPHDCKIKVKPYTRPPRPLPPGPRPPTPPTQEVVPRGPLINRRQKAQALIDSVEDAIASPPQITRHTKRVWEAFMKDIVPETPHHLMPDYGSSVSNPIIL